MTQPRMVGSRYELGELIGYGGMAEVHRGLDTRLNRQVAIKVLRADLARDPSFLTRFRREAHSAAGLNHPAIVSVYDTGEDLAADGTAIPFIVMEYVEGRTLRDILKAEGSLPARRAMEIGSDICSALDFSHRNGIIHRDIKPANVMITPAGAVKVMDFGIARAVADTSATVTQTANVIGTAQYLSPEQARGEAVDARSDVYSSGCLLYELVTGVPPFQGDSPVAVAYQHVRENPVAPSSRNSQVPRALDSVIMKSLAKNQLNRYQSAGDMRSDLQRALAEQPVIAETVMTDAERTQFIARTPPPPVPPRRDYYDDDEDDAHRRRNSLIWAAAVLALLLVIGVGGYFILRTPASSGPKMVAVSDVTGQSPAVASDELKRQDLVARPGDPTSGTCTGNQNVVAGHVCTTTPAVGKKVPAGTQVLYHLYTVGMVQVPLVEGTTYAKAVRALGDKHLGFRREKDYNKDPEGTVESQSIQPYALVKPGTVVVLKVSTGTLKLPDVRGMRYGDALATLAQSFTNVAKPDYVKTSKPGRDNMVADESPKPGSAVDPDQLIQLTVYKYEQPQPIPPCTTPASPTSTPTTSTSSSSSSSSSAKASDSVPDCPTTGSS